MSRPYEALLAKGEDRRQHILEVALRLVAGNGSRATSLGQVARAAGMSTAGLLHHFQSKEQLLHAVLDARDAQDEAAADLQGEFEVQLRAVRSRFERSPGMIGMFTVLMCENLDPEAPLHQRFLRRYRSGITMIAASIQRGQQAGRFRTDVDPTVKAREVIAFLYGIEATWLLDPTVPAVQVAGEYTRALVAQLTLQESSLCGPSVASPWSRSSRRCPPRSAPGTWATSARASSRWKTGPGATSPAASTTTSTA